MSPDTPDASPPSLSARLLSLVRDLDGIGAAYMVVGAMAVAMWGRPRATAALDVTVLSDEAGLDAPARAVSQRGVRIDDAWLNSNPLLRGSMCG